MAEACHPHQTGIVIPMKIVVLKIRIMTLLWRMRLGLARWCRCQLSAEDLGYELVMNFINTDAHQRTH